jgi:hypothetical protein
MCPYTVGGEERSRPPSRGRLRRDLTLHTTSPGTGTASIAIPLPLVVQGDQEQVGAEQPFQQGVTIGTSGDRVAQIAVQPVQDSGLEQEILDLFRLLAEDLFGEGAAIQPSVLSSSTATSAGERERPITSFRKQAASRLVKRRSPAQ